MKSKSPKQESRNQLNFIPRSKSQDLWKTLEAIRQQKQKIKLKLEKLVEKLDEFTNARTTVIFFFFIFFIRKKFKLLFDRNISIIYIINNKSFNSFLDKAFINVYVRFYLFW